MAHEIKESDWKLLRKLAPIALERLSKRIIAEIAAIAADKSKTCHQRYLAIWNTIAPRDNQMAKAFNNLKRSTALHQLALMRSLGLLTEQEVSQFSQETKKKIELFGFVTQ